MYVRFRTTIDQMIRFLDAACIVSEYALLNVYRDRIELRAAEGSLRQCEVTMRRESVIGYQCDESWWDTSINVSIPYEHLNVFRYTYRDVNELLTDFEITGDSFKFSNQYICCEIKCAVPRMMVDREVEKYIPHKDGAGVISTMDLCDVRNLVQDRDKRCYVQYSRDGVVATYGLREPWGD